MDVDSKRSRLYPARAIAAPRVLLIGPHDPNCGEFTFLAPPLGVWRLQGYLTNQGIHATVFDPNLHPSRVLGDLERLLAEDCWHVIGVSTTGMTLQFDLALAHAARAACPDALMVAGGMEATFNPQLMFANGPFDMVILGEGEHPLREICSRLMSRQSMEGVAGTVVVRRDGELQAFNGKAMNADELRSSIFSIPYADMPYEQYWERLEQSSALASLPYKAQREARFAEIRAVRLITLNYCPMGCTFCSSTNFLHHAQGSVAGIARLSAADCLLMIERVVAAHPGVRTIVFQDDIFVFTNDKRVLPLCEGIVEAKRSGRLPRKLQFISTNRIDAMTAERLEAMRDAGFRVLGFGIENFSRGVLEEFNKGKIHRHIEPVLRQARRLGLTPFLDLILTSPRSKLPDLTETVRQAQRWILAGCEIGIYPYVIPFSGAAMSKDPELIPQTHYETRRVSGTDITWNQPAKILPLDDIARRAILQIEQNVNRELAGVSGHLPSRSRSLVWIRHAIAVLRALGEVIPDESSLADRSAETAVAIESCAPI